MKLNKKLMSLAAALLTAVVLVTACGAEYVGKVGSEKITKGEFEFYLAAIKQQMQGTELTSDEDWATKEIEGQKAIEAAKQKAFDGAVDNLSYIQVSKKLKLTLTSDEKKQAASSKEQLKSYLGGEAQYKSYLKERGITDGFITMMSESNVYYNKLLQKINQEEPATDKELEEYFREHYRRAKHILILTQDMTTGAPFDDEQKAAAQDKAFAVLDRALSGESFEALIDEFNEDPGMVSNPDGYVFTDGVMVQEFTDAVDSLEPGGITLAETDYGYHIIKRYDLEETPEYFAAALEKAKTESNQLTSSVISEKLDKQMEAWRTEFGINVEKNDAVYDAIGN